MANAPTLTTIKNLINANHLEVQNRLSAVEEQVKLTNGRVKALETAEAVAKGIAADRLQREAQSGSNLKKLSMVLVWVVPLSIALVEAFIWLGKISK